MQQLGNHKFILNLTSPSQLLQIQRDVAFSYKLSSDWYYFNSILKVACFYPNVKQRSVNHRFVPHRQILFSFFNFREIMYSYHSPTTITLLISHKVSFLWTSILMWSNSSEIASLYLTERYTWTLTFFTFLVFHYSPLSLIEIKQTLLSNETKSQ